MPQSMYAVAQRQQILQSIEAVRKDSPAAAPSVALVAVSKAHPAESMLPLLEVGHRVFGENKVQEAEAKWPSLRERFTDIELHLIGSLQSNKAKEALVLFDVIETIDRPSLVIALSKARADGQGGRCKAFYIQVNIGEEPQKGGVLPAELPTLLAQCEKAALPISGLMCVPPADENSAPYFAWLHTLAKRHGIKQVSMGMSGDYLSAVRLGATHVRVGTALFGSR